MICVWETFNQWKVIIVIFTLQTCQLTTRRVFVDSVVDSTLSIATGKGAATNQGKICTLCVFSCAISYETKVLLFDCMRRNIVQLRYDSYSS